MRTTKKTLGGLIAVVALLALVAPAAAFAGPELELNVSHLPPTAPVPVGTSAIYEIGVSNTGDDATSENVTVNFTAPEGFEITKVSGFLTQYEAWACSLAGSHSVSCQGPMYVEFGNERISIGPGEKACVAEGGACPIRVTLRAEADAATGPTDSPLITACGGGDTLCPAVATTATDGPLEIVPLDFHLTKLEQSNLQENGELETRAGSHPFSNLTEFLLNTFLGTNRFEYSTQDLKDVITDVPPGLVGNPLAVGTCTEAQLSTSISANPTCPADSQVGTVEIPLNGNLAEGPGELGSSGKVPVYNMKVPFGLPGLFAFRYTGNTTQLYVGLRTGGDYGVRVTTKNVPETIPVAGSIINFWGIPGDPSHDAQRRGIGCAKGCAFGGQVKPFLTMPTSCTGPMTTSMRVTGWLGAQAEASTTSHNDTEEVGNSGCDALDFSPSLEARPTTNVADSPTGLEVDLKIPQHEACDPGPPLTCETAEAHLRDTRSPCPKASSINPAGANGLDGLLAGPGRPARRSGPAQCPDASKLGTVRGRHPAARPPAAGRRLHRHPVRKPLRLAARPLHRRRRPADREWSSSSPARSSPTPRPAG